MNYAIIEEGIVTNVVVWDGTPYSPGGSNDEPARGWSPPSGAEAVVMPPESGVAIGWTFESGNFFPPSNTSEKVPTDIEVLARRSELLNAASLEIAPLQDLVDLGDASEDDEDKLLEWKQYRAAVSKVQTQPGFPADVVWPEQPEI